MAHKTAINSIKDATAKVNKEKQKVDELELSLDKEEKVLEGIQDSLKGTQIMTVHYHVLICYFRQDPGFP